MSARSPPNRSTSGLAAVEFALLGPFFALLVAFMVDAGSGISARTQVQNAAQAGARYAQVNGWSPTGIANAVTSATDLANVKALPAAQLLCGCPTGTAVQLLTTINCTIAVPANTYCVGVTPPEIPGRYVVVGAQYSYSAPLSVAIWPSVQVLTATATTRLD